MLVCPTSEHFSLQKTTKLRMCEIGRIPSPARNQTAAAAAPRSFGRTIFVFFPENTRSSVSFLLRFHGNWENKQTNYLISSNSPFLNWLDWRLYRETWKLGRIQEYFKGARICGAKAPPLHPPLKVLVLPLHPALHPLCTFFKLEGIKLLKVECKNYERVRKNRVNHTSHTPLPSLLNTPLHEKHYITLQFI